jgi:error-prone DNA polymerase
MLIEDEHGQSNLIVPSHVYEAHRGIVRGEPLILAQGKLERHGKNINLLVWGLESLGPLARQAANEAEVSSALPHAHHFGHR